MDNSESQPKAESQPSIPVETAGAEDAAAKAELTKSISQKLDPLVPSRTVPLPSSFIAVQAVREGVRDLIFQYFFHNCLFKCSNSSIYLFHLEKH